MRRKEIETTPRAMRIRKGGGVGRSQKKGVVQKFSDARRKKNKEPHLRGIKIKGKDVTGKELGGTSSVGICHRGAGLGDKVR